MRLFLTTEFHAIFSHFVLREKSCLLHFYIGESKNEQLIKKNNMEFTTDSLKIK